MIDSFAFKHGMRRLAAGVSIVTTSSEGALHGLVATSVCAVSADPIPSLLVCVNRNASAHDRILQSENFCVNVLSEDDREMAQCFSGPDRARRFESHRWTSLKTGAPALEAALASFDCRATHKVIVHSHTIFIGTILDIRLWRDDIAPLIHIDGGLRRLA
jgi:flavin reductase